MSVQENKEQVQMNITSITVKNVRGLHDETIQLNMIPNKPSLLIAPNGTGKSSFAFAFQWLNQQRLKLNEDDAYQGHTANRPELIIRTDEDGGKEYIANENRNDISKKFGIFVINNGLKASNPGVHAGVQMGRSKIVVPDIELLGVEPANHQVTDDFEATYDIKDAPVGLFPVINSQLQSNSFAALIDTASLKCGKRHMTQLVNFISKVYDLEGTIDIRHESIRENDLGWLHQIPPIDNAYTLFDKTNTGDSEVKNILRAVRLVTLCYRKEDDLKKRIRYARHKRDEESVKALFSTLKKTWRDIKPQRTNGKMFLKIGDAQRISNGERDILILLGMLQKAQAAFTKTDNILIIDEVFDYLDDANLVAAQHYVNLFIRQLKSSGRNIYPIILSHINPSYYRTFAFRDMKVYYLQTLRCPHASDNMMKLLRKRDELERTDKDSYKKISKYMLHYHTDYTEDLSAIIDFNEPNWGDIPTFKSYCSQHLKHYLDSGNYDALAVCVALREMIEKYCYNRIADAANKDHFLNEENGTEKKLDYAVEVGVVCPETFSLLGLMYNDPLHPNSKHNIDLRQTLYSRLENNTIRGMIEEISKL